MRNDKIDTFIEFCKEQRRTAFIYRENFKYKSKSYGLFYNDILNMRSMLEQKIKKNSRVLVFVYPYSYLFYVAMFAGFLSGLQLVIIDSFKNRQKLKEQIHIAKVEYVLLDHGTRFFSFILPNSLKKIHLETYSSYEPITTNYNLEATIITFTSGTTGKSKMISRDLNFLMRQVDLIKDNLLINPEDTVYPTLPMYALLACFLGNKIFLSKKYRSKKVKADVLLTSIYRLLKFKKPILSVRQGFVGGAILYSDEAKRIKNILPNANITYVYGASESALIYVTSLDEYLKAPFTFSKAISSIKCEIIEKDLNGVGEITISGDTVISLNYNHSTGDLGYIENNKLTIVGRKKFSQKDFYNYLMDETLRKQNPHCKNIFSFYFNNEYYCVYTGKLSKKFSNINYIHMKKFPMDTKHKTKLDYSKIIEDYIIKKRVK